MCEEEYMLTILPLEILDFEDVDKIILAILPLEEGEDSGSKVEC